MRFCILAVFSTFLHSYSWAAYIPENGKIVPYRLCFKGRWNLNSLLNRKLQLIHEPLVVDHRNQPLVCSADLRRVCQSEGNIVFGYGPSNFARDQFLGTDDRDVNYPAHLINILKSSSLADCLREKLKGPVKESEQTFITWDSTAPHIVTRTKSVEPSGVDLNLTFPVQVIRLDIYKSCSKVKLRLYQSRWSLFHENGKLNSPQISTMVDVEGVGHDVEIACLGDHCQWDRKMLLGAIVHHLKTRNIEPFACLWNTAFHWRLHQIFEKLYEVAPDQSPCYKDNPWLRDQAEFKRRHRCYGKMSSSRISTKRPGTNIQIGKGDHSTTEVPPLLPILLGTKEPENIVDVKNAIEDQTITLETTRLHSTTPERVLERTTVKVHKDTSSENVHINEDETKREERGLVTVVSSTSTIETMMDGKDDSRFSLFETNDTETQSTRFPTMSLSTLSCVHLISIWLSCVFVIILTFAVIFAQVLEKEPTERRKNSRKQAFGRSARM